MRTQVIEIDEQGGLQGLHFRSGAGLDLTQFGHARIKRCSEVLWNEEHQLFYCEFRQGRMDGAVLTRDMIQRAWAAHGEAGVETGSIHTVCKLPDQTAYFPTYDEAVAGEVLVIQGYALAGEPLL